MTHHNGDSVSKDVDIAFIPGVGHLDYYCGASESVFQIAKHMEVKPLVITDGPYGLTEKLRKHGLPYENLPSPVPLLRGIRSSRFSRKAKFGFAWARYAMRLKRLLRSRNVKVVYTTNSVAMLAASPIKSANARLVIGIRGGPDRIHRWWKVLDKSDRVAVLSFEMGQTILENLTPEQTDAISPKIEVMYNGVDFESIDNSETCRAEIRRQLNLPAEAKIVLYVAAFREWKGQLPFIQQSITKVMNRLPQGAETHFVFLGSATEEIDKDYERKCHAAAGQSKWRSHIHFAGYQKPLWRWYRAADLVALASQFEGMPRCIVESMACQTPAVTFDVCSVDELLSGSGAGIVVPQGDYQALSDGLVQLLVNSPRRLEMGCKAKTFAERQLDVRRVAAKYDELFTELIGTHSS